MTDKERVLTEFDTAARSYDRLVGANPGYHRHLELSARQLDVPDGGRGLRLLDAGCGTGASTAALAKVAPRAEIVAIDGSAEMLAQARRKTWPESVQFVHTPLERLGESGVHGPFDGIIAAYLVRNLPDVQAGLRSLFELLSPGARIAIHEYSLDERGPAKALWTALCWGVIIPAGTVATRRSDLYRYLWRSVLEFDGPASFQQRMRDAGLADVRVERMSGWQRGITHTFVAQRPGEPQ